MNSKLRNLPYVVSLLAIVECLEQLALSSFKLIDYSEEYSFAEWNKTFFEDELIFEMGLIS